LNQKIQGYPYSKKDKGVEIFCGICGQRHGTNEPHRIQTLNPLDKPSPISRIVNKNPYPKPAPAARALGGI
jgi:hypothetical protein